MSTGSHTARTTVVGADGRLIDDPKSKHSEAYDDLSVSDRSVAASLEPSACASVGASAVHHCICVCAVLAVRTRRTLRRQLARVRFAADVSQVCPAV
jgi:hypothetical protein